MCIRDRYGITGTTEIVYNPSYDVLFEEETKPELEGFETVSYTHLDVYKRQVQFMMHSRKIGKKEKKQAEIIKEKDSVESEGDCNF